jgi:hypothetical protein
MFSVLFLADIRSAEGWSVANVIGAVVLVLILAIVITAAIRVARRR